MNEQDFRKIVRDEIWRFFWMLVIILMSFWLPTLALPIWIRWPLHIGMGVAFFLLWISGDTDNKNTDKQEEVK